VNLDLWIVAGLLALLMLNATTKLFVPKEQLATKYCRGWMRDNASASSRPSEPSSSWSERRACRVAGQHRSTQRLTPRPRPEAEEKVRRRLREIARKHPRWGWKTAHTILRREGHTINRKRTRRLWRDEGLRRPPACKRKRTRPPGGGPLLRAEWPNHLWGCRLPVRRDRRSQETRAVQHR
jgi:hypothetical protein